MSVRDQDQRTVDDSKLVSLTLYDQKGAAVETYYCRPTFDDGVRALRLAKRLQNISAEDILSMIGKDRIPSGFFAKVRYFFRKEQGTAVDPVFHEIESFVVDAFHGQFTRKQLAQGVSMDEMCQVIIDISEKQKMKTPGLAHPNGTAGRRQK